MVRYNPNDQKPWTWDFIGYETVNVNNNSEYTGDLARWTTPTTVQIIIQNHITGTYEKKSSCQPTIVIEMLRIEQQLQQKVACSMKLQWFSMIVHICAFKNASSSAITHEAQKYYYSLIGVPKMDTWRGCGDLRPDPWGTEYKQQSQAPLSISIAAASAQN